MKTFIAVLVFALLGTAFVFSANIEAVKESARKLKQAHESCNADPATHVDEDALKNAHQHGGEPPANAAAHALCISKTLGWQNADGSVNKEVIRARASAIYGENPKLNEIVDECAQAQATPEATASYIFDCYRKYSPRPSGTHPRHH